jgi:hypothetical protein
MLRMVETKCFRSISVDDFFEDESVVGGAAFGYVCRTNWNFQRTGYIGIIWFGSRTEAAAARGCLDVFVVCVVSNSPKWLCTAKSRPQPQAPMLPKLQSLHIPTKLGSISPSTNGDKEETLHHGESLGREIPNHPIPEKEEHQGNY